MNIYMYVDTHERVRDEKHLEHQIIKTS